MKYEISKDGKSIKCLNCGLTSYNPIDVRDKYCGNCHVFLEDNELMKNLDPHFDKAIPTEEDCKRIKAQEAYYRKRLDKVMGEHMLVLFKIVCGKKKAKEKQAKENKLADKLLKNTMGKLEKEGIVKKVK